MLLAGETKRDMMITVLGSVLPIVLNLGKMVIVKNLGVSILVGEPGKVDNEIITYPHKRIIEFKASTGERAEVPYYDKIKTSYDYHCKAIRSEISYPEEVIRIDLPSQCHHMEYVNISPANSSKYS